jgi:hypothetical protein
LFRYRVRIVYLDAEISDSAFDLGVPEQELHGSQVTCSPVDQRCLSSTQGMRAKHFWVKPGARDPTGKKSGKLTGRHGSTLSPLSGE